MYNYGDTLTLTYGPSIKVVVVSGKKTLTQRLKLAWRILRGKV